MMPKAYTEAIDIDYAHDSYKVTFEPSTIGGDGRVRVFMWSRGSFSVNVTLSPEDALAFADVLREAALTGEAVSPTIGTAA